MHNVWQRTVPRIVVIDDERNFGDMGGWTTYCRTSTMGIVMLNGFHPKYPVDELWLDHDLGDDDTIMPVVDWLCERAFNDDPINVREILVHTQNPVGGEVIVRTLNRYGYNARRVGLPEAV